LTIPPWQSEQRKFVLVVRVDDHLLHLFPPALSRMALSEIRKIIMAHPLHGDHLQVQIILGASAMKKKEYKKFLKTQKNLVRFLVPSMILVAGMKMGLKILERIKSETEYQEPLEGMMPDP
jgi:hypothetical protein